MDLLHLKIKILEIMFADPIKSSETNECWCQTVFKECKTNFILQVDSSWTLLSYICIKWKSQHSHDILTIDDSSVICNLPAIMYY